jgi:hypothetical protein
MKFAWRRDLPDHAALNWARVEEVQLGEYSDILEADEMLAQWDLQFDDDAEFILEYMD